MKADRCGAWAEQKRFRAGWVTATERKQLVQAGKLKPGNTDGQKCLCCTHLSSNQNHCTKGDFATRVNCWCDNFELKKDRQDKPI